MPDQVDEQQKLWDLIEKIGFCMRTSFWTGMQNKDRC